VQPEFTYRHRWTVGDIVMWDNRCTMHLALADFDPSMPRHMFRTTLQGAPLGCSYAPDPLY
jgi:taurine dioxygenase